MRSLPLLLGLLVLSACGTQEQRAATPASPTASSDVEAGHVHGLGVDPGDRSLLVATHHGLFRVDDASREVTPVGEPRDLMGFTIVGGGSYLASGHPGPGQPEPARLGLVASKDAGRTWRDVSLTGEADFHVLEAAGRTLYGVDGATGRMLVSADGGRSWKARTPPGQVFDLAVDPRDPERAVAATQDGLHVTRDAGRRWRPLNPRLTGLLAWAERGGLYLVDAEALVHRSRDGGRSFREVGAAGGPVTAFAADEEHLHVALADGQIRRAAVGEWTFSDRASLTAAG